ncbi:ammonia-forming cytochrome c nitrite reductase subunit c552 [Methylomonas sp. LL1]|uniref:ammonia-forming cytochrome c nitrite reductase subunit c552 n=1 Tax=Methylomonas sp. LL1 TaxID=2785785 RepID=UPI001E552A36|nr:ammonia-forming cytochrome c nitrite reductase subunit c552 [Methylomonas sp. LL1]
MKWAIPSSRGWLLIGLLAALGLGLFYVYALVPKPVQSTSVETAAKSQSAEVDYVGREACASCHGDQDKLWQGSHHDLAMQEVGETSVLGDFQDAEFSKDGVISRFFRQNGRYMVRTDGPDGKLTDFEIKYTFGVTPLQQYLIELPGGKLQALSIVWDSRPKQQGGQRWFHLYPNEKIDHNDELHWTRRSQNWNFMCAECHSTHLQKNYDAASRTYHTTWSEIDVSCEACHGPGSRHLAWARSKSPDDASKGLLVNLNERRQSAWAIDAATGNAVRNQPRQSATEIEVCARCHSRRAQLFGDYRHGPLMDSHLPSILTEQLYHADGQIDGEVYEYGSFLQSKMYRAGVSCSDCHEPHSLKLRQPGNAMCGQCHSSEKYDSDKHHFHPAGGGGSLCVDCHMPSKTYMGVDARRDHSFRVPRPDLSATLGTPNACNGCHADKPAAWAAAQVKAKYGHDAKGLQQYAEALHAARTGAADAEQRLLNLLQDKQQPAIARASAVAALGNQMHPELVPVIANALRDSDPLLRRAGLEVLEQMPPEQRWPLAHDVLRDPLRTLRALAASALASAADQNLTAEQQHEFDLDSSEYLNSLRWNADDPAAQVNLGNFYSARNQSESAERAYREALQLDANWLPAYINLADHLRTQQRDGEGERILKEGLVHQPDAAELHHSLGLLAIRRKNLPQALSSLKRAAELAPTQPRFAYVYAVALSGLGRKDEAKAVVKSALDSLPNDPELTALREQLDQPN